MRFPKFLFFALIVALALGAPLAAFAQSPAPGTPATPGEAGVPAVPGQTGNAIWLSKQDKADVLRVEKYLNTITTLDARFLQVTSLGEFSEGTLAMSRPGRLRIEYDDPNPVLIVANHGTIKYVDRELGQVSHFPLDDTPAGMLLSERVRLLDKSVAITNIEREAQVIRISLRRTEDPRQGELTLSLSLKPMKLVKWDVVDAQGLLTAVVLQGARFGLPLKDDLFKYDAPEKDDPRS